MWHEEAAAKACHFQLWSARQMCIMTLQCCKPYDEVTFYPNIGIGALVYVAVVANENSC
jgi:hypothetical protein